MSLLLFTCIHCIMYNYALWRPQFRMVMRSLSVSVTGMVFILLEYNFTTSRIRKCSVTGIMV